VKIPTIAEIDFELEKRKRSRERSQYSEKLKSKKFRMENLYQIVDKANQAIFFKMNQEQNELYDKTWNETGTMINSPKILKSRQIGVSTLFVLCYLDDALNTPNLNVYIQSHKDDSIEKIFRIVRFAYDHLPEEHKPMLGKGGGSKYELYFPLNNSRIYVGLENRSNTIHRVHFSEMAFQDKAKVAASLGALPIGQCYSVETTPNGMNWFREDWVDTRDNKFFFPWFTHAENKLSNVNTGPYTEKENELINNYKLSREQIEFRRAKINAFPGKDERLFLQEFPEDEQTCFMLSGNPVVSLEAIKRMTEKNKNVKVLSELNGIKIYRDFSKSLQYVCAADTSEGFSNDYSCAKIFDSERRECASVRIKLRPSDFAHKIKELCDLYSSSDGRCPLLAVERNNHGHAVLLELEEHIGYTNLFFYKSDRSGWLTDRVTRPIMISAFLDAVENETIFINDIDTINECLTLIDNAGKIEGATGQNDDCIITTAIAIQMLAEVAKQSAYNNPKDYILM
jgi:hypothetical protein